MDLVRKLSTSDRIVVASTFVLVVSAFLDWFTGDYKTADGVISGSRSIDGWDVTDKIFWVTVPVVLALLALAVTLVRAFSRRVELPRLPIGYGQATFFAGLAAAALVLMKFLIGEEVRSFVIGTIPIDVDVKRAYGIFIALIAAIGFAIGGYMKWQEEKSGYETGASSPTPF
jgi:hypothetical protein